MFSYKEITELAGYTSRVATLLDVMADIKAGRFEKTMVSDESSAEHLELMQHRGTIIESEDIEFINVYVHTVLALSSF
jgi:ATP-binding cassette subfamily D (ALD) long-chain fatty acid import protein